VLTVRLGPRAVEAAPGRASGVPVVAFAGVMGAQDTVDVLIEAFALVLRGRPGGARLELMGRGEAVAGLQRRVDELGIGDAVTWTGWLPRSEMRRRLGHATVGVSPDVDNPYTRTCTMIKVSEYLSVGLPAVVADLPENRATAGDAAAYFRAGDAADLAAQLSEVLFEPQRHARMADAARHRAQSLLWARSAPRLVAAYRHLLDGGPPVPGEQHVDDVVIPVGA
jgi:glycosyltransferase involved in cell wall biosynthesis